ncbi:MAG: hypothetical protein JSR33_05055 [Proteobacteria bacterium]|nr:hypothetical protein [Pseudomonadota bacterium]
MRPIIFIFLDVDGTLIKTSYDTNTVQFHGADKPDDIGPWAELLCFPERYAKYLDIRILVLTARQGVNPSSVKIAQLLNLKNYDKLTGEECKTDGYKLHFAIHHKYYGYLYIEDTRPPTANHCPCFVWKKSSQELYYFLNQENYKVFALTKKQKVKIAHAVKSEPCDQHIALKHKFELYDLLANFESSQAITYLKAEKLSFFSNYTASNLCAAFNYAPMTPKGVVMKTIREQPWVKDRIVLTSFLLDDLAKMHQQHTNPQEDCLIDCEKFEKFFNTRPSGSKSVVMDSIKLVKNYLETYTALLETAATLKPCLPETQSYLKDFKINQRVKTQKQLDHFINDEKEKYQPIIECKKNSQKKFFNILFILNDFSLLSKHLQEAKDPESINQSFFTLDRFLKLVEHENWSGSDYRLLSPFPFSINKIRTFLESTSKELADYQRLINYIKTDLRKNAKYYLPKTIVFCDLVIRLFGIRAEQGFDLLVNLIIEKFSKGFLPKLDVEPATKPMLTASK